MTPAIQIRNLEKRYSGEPVLRNVSIDFPRGKSTLILGHNGCGKTTLMKCLIGLVRPTDGDINFPDFADAADVRSNIGYLPQQSFFPDNITPAEIFELIGDLRPGVSLSHEKLVERFDLRSFLSKRVKELSGGTLQKVGVVSALMAQPRILLLDEPTAGLDPKSRFVLKQILNEQQALGVTTIITSHIVSEHEELCENIVVLSDGRVRYSGLAQDLQAPGSTTELEAAIVALLDRPEGM